MHFILKWAECVLSDSIGIFKINKSFSIQYKTTGWDHWTKLILRGAAVIPTNKSSALPYGHHTQERAGEVSEEQYKECDVRKQGDGGFRLWDVILQYRGFCTDAAG